MKLALIGAQLCAAALLPRKVLLPEPIVEEFSAKCLDSSPAGYFIREQDPKKWILMIDGGGLCIDALDCRRRADTAHGSSTHWPSSWDPQAVPFTSGRSAFFADFSQVFVPYCSGDLWLGQDRAKRLIIGELQMSGHLILNAVVEHLMNTTKLRRSSLVVFAGASAGGIGVFHHADWITSKLHSLGISPRSVVLPIAGLFFPERWPVLWEEFRMGVEVPVDGFMASWCHLLEGAGTVAPHMALPGGSFLHEGCVANATAAKRPVRECQDVSKILPLLKAEVFIFQNQFDQYQVNHLGFCPADLCNASTATSSRAGRYLELLGRRTRETLQATIATQPRLGVLAPSWFDHTNQLEKEIAGAGQGVSGWSFAELFAAWLDGRQIHLLADACAGGPCPLQATHRSIGSSLVV